MDSPTVINYIECSEDSMKNFEGKVAVITGAGSGMGRELAIELAKSGEYSLSWVEWRYA